MRAQALWRGSRHRNCHIHRLLTRLATSVAYFDPGNWSVDLQAGSEFGYRLLFIVLLSSLVAMSNSHIFLRQGCVTGADLAVHCRLLFGNHPKHPKLVRALVLWPLYALAEIAIIATDLAELLGSAIGLCLLIGPSFPLWAGVLLTACDVLLVLTICRTRNGRPTRVIEILVVVLVAATFICFIVLIVKVQPHWLSVFQGYLPSKALVQHGAIYTCKSLFNIPIKPHALFLGSSLGTLDRVSDSDVKLPAPNAMELGSLSRAQMVRRAVKTLFGEKLANEDGLGFSGSAKNHAEWENSSLGFVMAHLKHAVADIIASLLGFAMLINSAILILAAAVFFNAGTTNGSAPAGLFDAHALIARVVGKPAGYLFAVALLCAGQSASLTATMAGQVVSEGFIEWRVSPFLRRLVTRLLSLAPSAIVASVFGARGIDALLVGSQVALSFVLPFVVFPLVYLTSSSSIMRVEGIDYSNGRIVTTLGWLIFGIVVLANGYAIVTLAMGQGGAASA
ncbi:natural resistance-associated macrophage protein [Exidia glandulosa HHB12029]|uniref:Natural resistance-associated macrophage protein n=1 Tax=Exidia glandulosa HHB12029 TaxID=1314781 RepID=A0A166NIX1_EXIGL|nr:natural resistance-associated macrophage protein [Exidia glandulosa HHB12029]